MNDKANVCKVHDGLQSVPKKVAARNSGERAGARVPAKGGVGTETFEAEAAEGEGDDQQGVHEGHDMDVPSEVRCFQDDKRGQPNWRTHQLFRSRFVLSRP